MLCPPSSTSTSSRSPDLSAGLCCLWSCFGLVLFCFGVQGRNVLRAWQDKPEAARYALMLRAEDLPLGKPTELPMSVSNGASEFTANKLSNNEQEVFYVMKGEYVPSLFSRGRRKYHFKLMLSNFAPQNNNNNGQYRFRKPKWR